MTEKQLLNRLKDPKSLHLAFSDLVSIYKERLYWHIRKIVISHADADDVLQNTFIKVYKNISKFKGDSQLYSWMYRIATNEAITHINKRAKKRQCTIQEVQDNILSNLSSDPYFDGDHVQLQLQKAVASLPQKQQLVFNMKYFDAMKYTDMSKILDTSVGALKASYHIAKQKIKNYLLNTTAD